MGLDILDLMGGAHGGGVRCHRDGLIQGGHRDLKGGVPRLVDREIGLISHHHIVIAVAAPHHGGGQSAVLRRQQGRRFHCGPTAAAGQFHLHPVLAVGQGSIRRLTGGLFPGAGGHGQEQSNSQYRCPQKSSATPCLSVSHGISFPRRRAQMQSAPACDKRRGQYATLPFFPEAEGRRPLPCGHTRCPWSPTGPGRTPHPGRAPGCRNR